METTLELTVPNAITNSSFGTLDHSRVEHQRSYTIIFNDAVEKYADHLYRFVLKHLRDADLSKDVVQDTLIKVWEKITTICPDKIKSYIFAVAYHTLIDYTRRRKSFEGIEHVGLAHFDSSMQVMDLQTILHHALDKLPAIQKSTILLRDYEGYSYSEIAKILGITETNAKVHIFRARKKLKSSLQSVYNVLEA